MDTKTLIEQFNPRTPLQEQSKELILRELEKYGSRLYLRDTIHAHLSASAIILNPGLDKTLMIYHNIYDSYAWTGGHADGEEDLYQVAYNEAREETGIKTLYPISRSLLSVESLPVLAHIKNGREVPCHDHYNVTFGFICPDNQPLSIKTDENSSVAWLDIDSLYEACSEKEMVPIYLDDIRQILTLIKLKERNYQLLPDQLLPWYKKNARDLPWRKDTDPYHVWISEIMLQQTRVDTVITYYNRFLLEFPTIEALANADIERVLKIWEGLGYYSRARNLQKAAIKIVDDYGGKFPEDPKLISQLPGIGAYTTGAIASICFSQPVSAVDGNVLRVLSRITEDYRCIDEENTKKEIAKELTKVYPPEFCGDFTQSLMELGATVCLPNGQPLCQNCPASGICMAYQNENYALLPIRKEKKPRKVEKMTVFILIWDEKIAIRKRQEKGVLYDLWELPNVAEELDNTGVMNYLQNQGGAGSLINVCKGKHIFTHIQWDMVCYSIRCEEPFGDFSWANQNQLEREISLPKAFKKFIESEQMIIF